MIAPVAKLARAVQERGWKGAFTQLYLVSGRMFQKMSNVSLSIFLSFTISLFQYFNLPPSNENVN